MTWLALPWFVLTTTGSGGQDDARPRQRGCRAGVDGFAGRNDLDEARAALDDDDRGWRKGAVHADHSAPVLERRTDFSAPARTRLRRGALSGPYFAAQRTLVP